MGVSATDKPFRKAVHDRPHNKLGQSRFGAPFF